jgi:mono/diheme cytochrome c family protein
LVKRGIGIALLSICLTLVGTRTVTPQAGTPAPTSWGVIQQNCVGCHNSKAKAGGRAFDVMSPDNIAQDAETWESASSAVV